MPETQQVDPAKKQAEANLVAKLERLKKMEQNDAVKASIQRTELYLTNIRQQAHAK